MLVNLLDKIRSRWTLFWIWGETLTDQRDDELRILGAFWYEVLVVYARQSALEWGFTKAQHEHCTPESKHVHLRPNFVPRIQIQLLR